MCMAWKKVNNQYKVIISFYGDAEIVKSSLVYFEGEVRDKANEKWEKGMCLIENRLDVFQILTF